VVSLAAAEEAIELADAYGVADGNPLAESQKITLRNGLGERADGSWAATRIADFGPRQGTGKNDKIAARELAGLLLFGEQLIIHTAHEFPTANESFLRLVAVFDAWDDLRRKVSRIRYANGEQGIELRTGQRLKYRARTGGSGRGFAKADLVVYDEAQHLAREHVAASGPAKLANPNAQTWYAGSGGLSSSAVAWEIRRAALMGKGGRLAYTEMTAETLTVDAGGTIRSSVPDLKDPDVWYRVIPGLGRWVTEEGVEALWDELGELAPRELLCIWDPEPGSDAESTIPNWNALEDADSEIVSGHAWALAVSPVENGPQWSALGVSGRTADGRLQVAWLAPDGHRKGTAWVVPAALEYQRKRPVPLRVHTQGPEGALISSLREAGVDVEEVSTGDVERSTGLLIAAATGEDGAPPSLVHLGQASLNRAVRGAVLRTGTNGAASWSQRSSSVEITPLKAVTVALGGVPQSGAVPNIY
jgi:hypothetical protein